MLLRISRDPKFIIAVSKFKRQCKGPECLCHLFVIISLSLFQHVLSYKYVWLVVVDDSMMHRDTLNSNTNINIHDGASV